MELITLAERTEAMVTRYGEVCSKVTAAKAIHCSTQTITHMLEDGRLNAACEGKRVDVRSLARYIHEPAVVKEERRKRRVAEKYGLKVEWVI